MIKRASIAIIVSIFAYLYLLYVFPFLRGDIDVLAGAGLVFFTLVGATVLNALLNAQERSEQSYWPMALFGLSLLLILPFSFMRAAFGAFDVSSILMTFAQNDARKLTRVAIDGFVLEFFLSFGKLTFIFLIALVLYLYVKYSKILIYFCAAMPILFGPPTNFVYQIFFPDPAHQLIDVKEVSLPPQIDAFPENRKNLIIIYLESLERTYRLIDETKFAFSKFAELEDRGISFRQVRQVTGTGLTIGGMVASQCGAPLLPKGLFDIGIKMKDKTDRLPDVTEFLGGLTCLGDILARDGYNATYINGSDLKIFSKGDFFRSHGYNHVLGLKEYRGWENEPRQNVWGMNDDLLFERVEKEIDRLSRLDAPFALTALTIGTHGPDAFLDESCRGDNFIGSNNNIAKAIFCTGQHINRLINHVNDIGIADRTIFVLLSDHLTMRNTLSEKLERHEELRSNYATILGADKNERISREASMFDMFPTILEVLGYKLANGRAGLGRSLVSNTETIVEKYGTEMVDDAIRSNAALQRAIWSRSGISTAAASKMDSY